MCFAIQHEHNNISSCKESILVRFTVLFCFRKWCGVWANWTHPTHVCFWRKISQFCIERGTWAISRDLHIIETGIFWFGPVSSNLLLQSHKIHYKTNQLFPGNQLYIPRIFSTWQQLLVQKNRLYYYYYLKAIWRKCGQME